MKTKIMLAAMLLVVAAAASAQKTTEKRTWRGTGSSESYVMKNGELVPADQASDSKSETTTVTITNTKEETAASQAIAKSSSQTATYDARPGAYRMAKDYYGWAGKSFLSFVSGGYTYDIFDNTHILDASVLDWRVRCFGMSLLNFEVAMSPFDKRAVYKPTVNFYIPVCKAMAVKLYGGAECDMSYVYKADRNYDYVYDRDFFFNVDAGLGFQFVPYGCVPIEVLAEYRYPIQALTKDEYRFTQGFYVTGRIYLGMPFGRTR